MSGKGLDAAGARAFADPRSETLEELQEREKAWRRGDDYSFRDEEKRASEDEPRSSDDDDDDDESDDLNLTALGDDPAKWWVFEDAQNLTTHFESYLAKQVRQAAEDLQNDQSATHFRNDEENKHNDPHGKERMAKKKKEPKKTFKAHARPSGHSFSACGQSIDVLLPGLSKSASEGALFADANKRQSAAALMQKRIRESKLPTHAQLQSRAQEKLARIRLDKIRHVPLEDARAWKAAGPRVKYGDGPILLAGGGVRKPVADAKSGMPKLPLHLRQSARARVAAKIEAKRRAEQENDDAQETQFGLVEQKSSNDVKKESKTADEQPTDTLAGGADVKQDVTASKEE